MKNKQSSDLVKVAIALLDLGLITASFYLALWLRFGYLAMSDQFIWLYYFSAPLILLLLLRNGVLTGFRHQRLRDIFKGTLLAFGAAGVISSTVLYLSKTADYSRLVFAVYFTLAFTLVMLEKVVVKKLFDHYLRLGRMNTRLAMIGFGDKFQEIARELKERPQWGIAVVRELDPRELDIAEIVRDIRGSIIDEVYIVYPRKAGIHDRVDDILSQLEQLGLPIRVALNYDELQSYYGQQLCTLASKPGVMLAPYNLDPDQLILKRLMDLVGSIIGLMITTVIFPIMAIAIKVDSPGPVLFSHIRVGKGGREFTFYKFRSMFVDAEDRKQELQQQNIHSGPLFKVESDPRVTKVGRVIRKYSLDELPQFWNVFKGEMSLVGTRPPTLDEVSQYQDHHFRRISIKPGLTGLWQVSGRNKVTDFDEVVNLDVRYMNEWNLWLDLRIIFRTVAIVLFPRGGGTGI